MITGTVPAEVITRLARAGEALKRFGIALRRVDRFRDVMSTDTVYICGPMTGLPDFNRSAFNRVAGLLEGRCVEVMNPARHPDGLEWSGYMRLALVDLSRATRLVILPGYGDSKGAVVEIYVADRLGIPLTFINEVPA